MRHINKRGAGFVVEEGANREFWDWFESPTWEPDTTEALCTYVTGRTLFIDVGAWIGDTVLLAASRARAVIAFEPDPIAVDALARNLQLNPAITNVQVRQAALSDRTGAAQLTSPASLGDSLSQLAVSATENGQNVSSLDIRQFLSTEPLVQSCPEIFFKVDAEGSEYEIVPAMAAYLAQARPHLLLSFHPNLRYRKSSLVTKITSGYRVLLDNRRVLRAVRAYKHHFSWNPSASAFSDRRRDNLFRVLLPLPFRFSLLTGTYLFTTDARVIAKEGG